MAGVGKPDAAHVRIALGERKRVLVREPDLKHGGEHGVDGSGCAAIGARACFTGGPFPSLRRSSAWQSALRTPAEYSSNCVFSSLRTVSAEYRHGCQLLLGAVWYSQ